MMKNIYSQDDVEKSWLLQSAEFDNDSIRASDIPLIATAIDMPHSLISFSRRNEKPDFSSWIHFYEVDKKFMPLWNNPHKYVRLLKRFGGIISPDFRFVRTIHSRCSIIISIKTMHLHTGCQPKGFLLFLTLGGVTNAVLIFALPELRRMALLQSERMVK